MRGRKREGMGDREGRGGGVRKGKGEYMGFKKGKGESIGKRRENFGFPFSIALKN